MDENGGINDDCIVTKDKEDKYFVVVNGACKDKDYSHMKQVKENAFKGKDVEIKYKENH